MILRPVVFFVGFDDNDPDDSQTINKMQDTTASTCEQYGPPTWVRWTNFVGQGYDNKQIVSMVRKYTLLAMLHQSGPVFVFIPKVTGNFIKGLLETYSDANGPVDYLVITKDLSHITDVEPSKVLDASNKGN